MEKPKILVGSPVCHKPEILREFLVSLKNINIPGINTDFLFTDDNTNPESKLLLKEFNIDGSKVEIIDNDNRDDYICTEDTHMWNDKLIWKVAGFKNEIISYTVYNNYDYLFLVDSDILLHPGTLLSLIEADRDIISEIMWTRWTPLSPRLPQVWLHDQYRLYVPEPDTYLTIHEIHQRIKKFKDMLKVPGIYKVGGLGACTLIKRNALDAGVSFAKIPNISIWGEDRHFCIRAAVLGFDLFVDTHHPACHIYRDSDLIKAAAFKKKCRYR